jgi:NADH-quinone oxidoreductase subunit M
MSHYLSLLLLLPVAGAVAMLCLPKRHVAPVRWLANSVGVGHFLLSVPLWFWYNPRNPDFQLVERARWIPSIGAEYFLGIDGISTMLLLLTTLIGCVALLSSPSADRGGERRYYATLLTFQTGMVGALLSLDFLLFFLSWEVMLAAMYFLIRDCGTGNHVRSARRFLVCTGAGSAAMLAGIVALSVEHHGLTGVYTFDILRLQQETIPANAQWGVFLALLFGFGTAVPLFPFHVWVAEAYADAPTAGSLVLAALLLKAGAYGLLRFSAPILPEATRQFVPLTALLAGAGVIYGAAAAFAQHDWKRLLAYASMSQMSLVILGILALNPAGLTGSVLQLINHGISTGALLLLIAAAYGRRHTHEASGYRGLSSVTPAFAAVLLIATLGWIGIPASNGFVSGRLLFEGVRAHSRVWAVFAAGGLALGATYMLRAYVRTVFGQVSGAGNSEMRAMRVREWAMVAPLVALALWIGLFPTPFLERINLSALKVAARVDPAYAGEFAAACDTTVTPELKAAAPGNQFLAAAPCGPDGQPLPPGTATAPVAAPAGAPGAERAR